MQTQCSELCNLTDLRSYYILISSFFEKWLNKYSLQLLYVVWSFLIVRSTFVRKNKGSYTYAVFNSKGFRRRFYGVDSSTVRKKNGQFFVTSMIELCPLTLKVDRFKNRHRYCHFQIKQKLIRQRAIESDFFFFSFQLRSPFFVLKYFQSKSNILAWYQEKDFMFIFTICIKRKKRNR